MIQYFGKMQQESHDLSNENNVTSEEQIIDDSGYEDISEDDLELINNDSQDSMSNLSNQQLNQPPIKIDEFKKANIPKPILQFMTKFDKLDPFKHFDIPPSKEVPKSVCAKVISHHETIIQCLDCAMDNSCIICLDCFKNGNHEGHKYVAKKAGGGCCDCGDKEAWKESGFCKNHSGQFLDFQISKKDLDKFFKVTDGLFYLYFYFTLQENQNMVKYNKKLLGFLSKLNQQDLYYNKMTSMALERKLSSNYSLNKNLNERTILENILTFAISAQQIHEWWNVFMGLFSYYPFKMDVLQFYMKNYSLIMDGSKEAKNCATSITCQLLTSYKLVQQYVKKNNPPLAYMAKFPKRLNSLWDFTIILLHDLKLISGLTQEAPLDYWRMHITHGLDNIFEYYQMIIKMAAKESEGMPETALLARYIHFCQIQFALLELFSKILIIIQKQPALLRKIIKFLYKKCSKLSENRKFLPTLRPYERCFTLSILMYFDYDLDNITTQAISKFMQQHILTQKKEEFVSVCFRIIRDIQQTYFLYSKCMAQTGFAQSMYGFGYFYRNKSSLISYTDIVCLRIMHLLINQPVMISIRDVIGMQKFEKLPKQNIELYNQELSKKQVYLSSVLTQILYLINSKAPEIYLANSMMDKGCALFKSEIQDYLQRIFIQKKGTLSHQDFTAFQAGIFSSSNKVVDEWIKQNTNYSKTKKQFIYNSDISKFTKKGINIGDFWINTSTSKKIQDPEKTIEMFSSSTRNIARLLFNQPTLKSMVQIFEKLYNENAYEIPASHSTLQRLFQFDYIMKSLNISDAKILEKILMSNKSVLPENLAALYGFEVLESKKSEEQQKKKMLELKNKKLEKFKKKQQDFMLKRQPQNKFPEKEQQIVGEQIQSCCICKNQDPQHFVYLVKVQVRNHEKLLGIGPGFECYSFSSCYHVFDYHCIQKNFKNVKMIDSIYCPLCKTSANILMPLSIKQRQITKEFLNRITQITFSLKDSGNLFEQIIKTFYHYTILASIDLANCLQKRLKIYGILLDILKLQIPATQVISLHQKFMGGKIGRNFDHPLIDKKNSGNKSIHELFQQILNTNQSNQQLEQLYPQLKITQIKQKKNSQKKDVQMEKVKTQQENSWLLIVTMNKLFAYLNKKFESESMDQEYPLFFTLCMDALFEKKIIHPEEIPKQTKQSQEKIKILVELPKKYTQVGLLRKCAECNQISSDLLLCLLCNWTGCQSCELGYAHEHIKKKHGEVGAFLIIKNGMAYYFKEKKTFSAGYLYQNYWGHQIKLGKDWNEFELNQNLYNSIQRCLVLDELPSSNKK